MTVLVAALLAAASVAVVTAAQRPSAAESLCGPGGTVLALATSPLACVHEDEAPAGVDVTEPVSTTELQDREGAGRAAFEAAEELGVPASYASNASSPAVTCDGDGASGYRVQAMYVVEAGANNRYSSLLSSFKLWAAGVDDVVNRSAALTGGVRHVRYVTEPGAGGTCEAKVLNVTVPAGSMSSFSNTISAVQALGYTNPARKYLLWTDANVLCGVATMYPNDNAAQGNPNNGSYPQYARVDAGCWGLGNGTNQHSVEAHELIHSLGGVQNSAPHSTNAGHCWDESDTMCYPDGGTHGMVQICPPEREYLLDCNTDDYFSTYPDPGSYLDTHWNAADNRFLIGGGDGSGGGSAGAPTVLGATIGVNNPAVPGLPTQVEVDPAIPNGRTLSSVAWTALRKDCTFSAPAELQSEVTCSATSAVGTTVTARLVDSTGSVKTVSAPLTFSAGTGRPVTVALTAAAQDGTAQVCTAAAFPLVTTVLDQASGLPVKGLTTRFTKQTATMTAAVASGVALSLGDGTATTRPVVKEPTTFRADVIATPVFGAASASAVVAVPSRCVTHLSAAMDTDTVYYGDPVTISGRLTYDAAGVDRPVAGATVPIRQSYLSRGVLRYRTLASTKTLPDGTFQVTAKPRSDGPLTAVLAASPSYEGQVVELGSVTVMLPETDLTAAADRTNVGFGDTVVLTGTLTRTAGGSAAGVKNATVSALLTAPNGTVSRVGTSRTLADGSYRINAVQRLSGTLSVSFAGAAGLPAASAEAGAVTVGTWDTALELTGTASSTSVQLRGVVVRTYDGATSTPRGVRVRIYFTPESTGVPQLYLTTATLTGGVFSGNLSLRQTGVFTAVLSGVVGYADASSNGFAVTY